MSPALASVFFTTSTIWEALNSVRAETGEEAAEGVTPLTVGHPRRAGGEPDPGVRVIWGWQRGFGVGSDNCKTTPTLQL